MIKFFIPFLFIISNPGYSQEVTELAAIEVKGSKEQKTILEDTASLSTVQEQELNRGDQPNSLQALNAFGNVQVTRNGESFSIRGISNMGVTGYQKDNLASIMIDDIFQTPLSLAAGSFELWDMDLIQILRGAQSATQGVNSLAGTILLYHNPTIEADEGAAKLVYGSYNRRELGLILNEKITDKFSARFTYNKEAVDGFIKNVTTDNDKWGAYNRDYFSSDFVYRINPNDFVRVNLKLLRNDTGGPYVNGDRPFDYNVYEDVDFNRLINNQQLGIYYNASINSNWANRLVLAMTRADQNSDSDADGTPLNTAGVRLEADHDNFSSIENLLLYKSARVKNVLGLHLHRYYLSNSYDFTLLYPQSATNTVPIDTTQDNEKYRTVYSIFDSAIIKFVDPRFSMNLGARLEIVQNKFGADIQARNLGAPNTALDTYLASISVPYSDDNINKILLPKIGYLFEENDQAIGVTYTQGYRTGGLSVNRARAEVSTYGLERTHNYELSYKYFKKKFSLTTNIFYIDWRDQQVEVKLTPTLFDTEVRNASNSALYGAEAEGLYEFENLDRLRVTVGHVQTRFENFTNGGINYRGNAFPDASDWTGMVSYWKFLTDRLSTILTAKYVSPSYSDAENLRSVPEHYNLDFNTQYAYDQFLFEFYVRNILDSKFMLYDGRPLSPTSPYQTSYHRVNHPRELGLRVNYFW